MERVKVTETIPEAYLNVLDDKLREKLSSIETDSFHKMPPITYAIFDHKCQLLISRVAVRKYSLLSSIIKPDKVEYPIVANAPYFSLITQPVNIQIRLYEMDTISQVYFGTRDKTTLKYIDSNKVLINGDIKRFSMSFTKGNADLFGSAERTSFTQMMFFKKDNYLYWIIVVPRNGNSTMPQMNLQSVFKE